MTQPTIEEYPYKVGMVVYRTLEQATRKANEAKAMYPEFRVVVVERATGNVVHEA